MPRLTLTSAVVMAVTSVGAPAFAQSPYQVRLGVDLPLLGLGLAGTSAALVEVPRPACLAYPSGCSPDGVNALDRTALGNYSPTAHTVADAAVIGLLALPLALDLIDSRGRGWIEDVVVMAQAVLLTQAATQLTKFAVRRPAPLIYDPSVSDEDRNSSDAARSFFSGHTSTAFAAATSYAVTFWLRHPRSPWRWVVLGVGGALAAGVGVLKVQAGYHYWTDVLAGAAVGVSIGALVPILHWR